MISTGLKVTTAALWKGTVIFVVIDFLFLLILRSKINPDIVRREKWRLVITTGVFWCLYLAIIMSWIFWDTVYHYVFPDWARWLIPPVYGFFFAAVGLLFWTIARRLPGNPGINWCLLGGLVGLVSHLWAIYRGLLDKPPMLQGVSPVAASILPIFEFIFYYCMILSLALLHPWFRPRTG